MVDVKIKLCDHPDGCTKKLITAYKAPTTQPNVPYTRSPAWWMLSTSFVTIEKVARRGLLAGHLAAKHREPDVPSTRIPAW